MLAQFLRDERIIWAPRITRVDCLGVIEVDREVSSDEIVAVWLRREFEGNWEKCCKPLNMTKAELQKIVESVDYHNHHDNTIRYLALLCFRYPLLASMLIAEWQEKTLSLDDFKGLRAIKAFGWDILSRFSGRVSIVAESVYDESEAYISFFKYQQSIDPNNRLLWNDCVGMVRAIAGIEQGLTYNKLDGNVILLKSDDSRFTTILEGNKTAVAFYIKCLLKNVIAYRPFKTYIGHLPKSCQWQWV